MWIKQHGSKYSAQGTPDLIGCVKGLFIALEVKLPGKEDTLTPLQEEIILRINLEGGTAAMVSSVEKACEVVEEALKEANLL